MALFRCTNNGQKVKWTDLAYAAGIIDGEGSITISKVKGERYRYGYIYHMEVKVGMIDAAIPNWLRETFGGSVRLYIKPKDRPQFVWVVSRRKAVPFLKAILPCLKLKRGQAETAIEFQRGKRQGKWHSGNPKPLVLLEAEGILRQHMRQLNHDKGRGKIGPI